MSVEDPDRVSRKIGGHKLVLDKVTSKRMARVKRKGTKPELFVRKYLHGLGVRFRVNNSELPGSPDLANRSRRWAIFVHGCFWHRHPNCARTSTPKRNREFWLEKFARNVERDFEAQRRLEQLGYRVFIVWECETKDIGVLARQLIDLIPSRNQEDS